MRKPSRFGVCLAVAAFAVVGVTSSTPSSAAPAPGTVSLGDARVWEGDNRPPDHVHTAIVPVTLAGPLSTNETVHYAVTGGTATPGPARDSNADYLPRSGTLSFPAGVVAKYIVLSIWGDTRTEGDETIELTLSNPSSGLGLGKSTGTVTIDDQDGIENLAHQSTVPSTIGVNVSDVSAVEGDVKNRMVKFTVTLSFFCVDTRVDYQLVAGTATGNWNGAGSAPVGTDFADNRGAIRELSFGSRVVQRVVTVNLAPDTASGEGNEQFSVVLSNARTGCAHPTAVGPPGTGTIIDDD